MNPDPQGVDRIDQSRVLLVLNGTRGMPPRAPVHHVKDDVLVHEQQVALHLLVEVVKQIRAACITRAGLGPLSAHLARLAVKMAWSAVRL